MNKNLAFYLASFVLFFGFLAAPVQAQEEPEEPQKDTLPLDPKAEKDAKRTAKIELDENMIRVGMKDFDDKVRGNKGIRVMFYNVENLFDTFNDSLTKDDEFLPDGVKAWTYRRYEEKLNNIYKVITAVGGWEMPEVIGFCEVENRLVLEDLIKKTPLRKNQYEIVHENSPDSRGIDVALIYRKDKFKYIEHKAMPVVFPFDPTAKTRDILYVKGAVLGKDTLHIFVNHWPSRWGGQAKSEPRRLYVASVIRAKIDSLYKIEPNAKVIVMGDLNDYATDKSVVEVLKAKGTEAEVGATDLFNYMAGISKDWHIGTHKYQGHWGTLDQIIVSAPLLKEARVGKLYSHSASIFAARFLLEEDRRNMGLQPFRTYAGPRHIGGFADHLPIYIDLKFREEVK
jgi:endonuclease/exonuclease/phosphatase family metal-dependent hydrolase